MMFNIATAFTIDTEKVKKYTTEVQKKDLKNKPASTGIVQYNILSEFLEECITTLMMRESTHTGLELT